MTRRGLTQARAAIAEAQRQLDVAAAFLAAAATAETRRPARRVRRVRGAR